MGRHSERDVCQGRGACAECPFGSLGGLDPLFRAKVRLGAETLHSSYSIGLAVLRHDEGVGG